MAYHSLGFRRAGKLLKVYARNPHMLKMYERRKKGNMGTP